MISFYPGPSRVYDAIPRYVKDAHRKGLLSMNHRSDEFMRLCESTVVLLKNKLNIPQDYTVFFTSSATECWEIIAQSLIRKESIHLYNGAFGEKWYDYTKRLKPGAKPIVFDLEKPLVPRSLSFPKSELICLTQNETSNGTYVSNELIGVIRKKNPNTLLAIDATSSMAGIELNFKNADIWFASVQKCFGLPAGLALMVCSPNTIKRILAIKENNHYNSLPFIHEMMLKWQTPYTPNVLGIYLLMRVLKESKEIKDIHGKIIKRSHNWWEFFQEGDNLKLFIENESVRSHTVITVTGEPALLSKVKSDAQKKGFLLGEGYGKLKPVTFRIANFPAIRKKEITRLQHFLMAYQ